MEYEDPNKEDFEVVIVLEFGETDRIDVSQIENSHVNKFMKNVSVLLGELKTQLFRSHGNIKLKNITLRDKNLKMSGYKPIYDDGVSSFWKMEIVRKVGPFRLDLFLLGCLWIEFLGYKLDEYFSEKQSYKTMIKSIREILAEVEKQERESNLSMLNKLLDIEKFPDYQIE